MENDRQVPVPPEGEGGQNVYWLSSVSFWFVCTKNLLSSFSVSGPGLGSLSVLLKTVNPSSNPSLPPVSLSALKKGAAAACQEDLGLPRWDTQAMDCVVCPPSFPLSPLRKCLPRSLASLGGTKHRQAALSWLSHCSLRI